MVLGERVYESAADQPNEQSTIAAGDLQRPLTQGISSPGQFFRSIHTASGALHGRFFLSEA